MPRFIIERDIPGVGAPSAADLKVYCVSTAPNDAVIREHADAGGFPAERVSHVKAFIGPTAAQ